MSKSWYEGYNEWEEAKVGIIILIVIGTIYYITQVLTP